MAEIVTFKIPICAKCKAQAIPLPGPCVWHGVDRVSWVCSSRHDFIDPVWVAVSGEIDKEGARQ